MISTNCHSFFCYVVQLGSKLLQIFQCSPLKASILSIIRQNNSWNWFSTATEFELLMSSNWVLIDLARETFFAVSRTLLTIPPPSIWKRGIVRYKVKKTHICLTVELVFYRSFNSLLEEEILYYFIGEEIISEEIVNKILIFVQTFEENGIFMLGVVFLFSQFSPIEITNLNKIFSPLKISTSWVQM